MDATRKSRVGLVALGVALLIAVMCFTAAPAHAATTSTYTQTKLGYQSQAITLKKGAVKLNVAAGASTVIVGIYPTLGSDGAGSGSQLTSTYISDAYGKATKYANVAKTGTYYLVFSANTYNGATGTKATVTNYPYQNATVKAGKTLTASTSGDNSTVAYYKLKVSKRGLLTVAFKDATESSGTAQVRLCNAKKKPFTSSDMWNYVQSGKSLNYGVKKGTYFLAVKSYTSLFKITPKLKAITKVGGASQGKAVNIAKGKKIAGVLAAGEKARWYKFTVPSSRKCTFLLAAQTDNAGLKFTFSGKNYYESSAYLDTYTKTKTFKSKKLVPGVYYLKIARYGSGTDGNGSFTVKWK